jgi:hypothetical protein
MIRGYRYYYRRGAARSVGAVARLVRTGAVVLALALATSCAKKGSTSAPRTSVRAFATDEELVIRLYSEAELEIGFPFRVDLLNFDFYPQDVRCDVPGATVRKLRTFRSVRTKSGTSSVFLAVRGVGIVRVHCQDQFGRHLRLIAIQTSP